MCFIVGPKAVFVRKSRFVEIKLLLADSKRNNFCDDVKLKRIYLRARRNAENIPDMPQFAPCRCHVLNIFVRVLPTPC